MTRECKQCNEEKDLNSVNFLKRYNVKNGEKIYYFTSNCVKCYYKNEQQKRKNRLLTIKPSIERKVIRQELMGSKTEPYFEGENFEYIAPTYEQIMKEYSL